MVLYNLLPTQTRRLNSSCPAQSFHCTSLSIRPFSFNQMSKYFIIVFLFFPFFFEKQEEQILRVNRKWSSESLKSVYKHKVDRSSAFPSSDNPVGKLVAARLLAVTFSLQKFLKRSNYRLEQCSRKERRRIARLSKSPNNGAAIIPSKGRCAHVWGQGFTLATRRTLRCRIHHRPPEP